MAKADTSVSLGQAKQLASCMELLSTLGHVGQAIWELGRWYVGDLGGKIEDLPYLTNREIISTEGRIEYLRTAIAYIRDKLKTSSDWRELPVDFRTFVESPKYMNKPATLWPAVIKVGGEINSGKYVECVLTGAIGVAKTTLALYTQAYQTYLLSCMKDMHRTFDLDSSSEIVIVFQSINKQAATDVDYRRLRDMIGNAPYFAEKFPYDKNRETDMRFPRNVWIKPVAGHDQAAIGQNVIGGILDEINFAAVVERSKMATDGGTYNQAKQNYQAIARRRESRFMQQGELPGMLCLVSSRKYPGQFTDEKEDEAKRNPRIYIYDKRIWELRPERFCGTKFRVFLGDLSRKPRVLRDDEEVHAQEAALVMEIPIEFKHQFAEQLTGSIRDIAGIATQAMNPFMQNTDAISEAFSKVKSIASRPEVDFFLTKPLIYPKRFINLEHPRFAHLDLAMTRDACGLAIGHCPGFKPVKRGEMVEVLPVIQYDLLLAIRAPRGGEIEFSKIRELLYTLRRLGLPIKWVSADNKMMSNDMLQILHQHNFTVGWKSMDTDTEGYDVLKQALYDRRVLAPEHALAQRELVRLEIDPATNKIDHPTSGSKDVSDAMAGVAYGLTMQRVTWVKHGVPIRVRPSIVPQKIEEVAEPVSSGRIVRYQA